MVEEDHVTKFVLLQILQPKRQNNYIIRRKYVTSLMLSILHSNHIKGFAILLIMQLQKILKKLVTYKPRRNHIQGSVEAVD
jgi:hypothetical protein